jgi:hypothetical protein
VRRAIVTLGALLACAALGSAAWAQTPAQMAKYQAQYAKNYTTYQNYLMTHGGVAPFSTGQGVGYNPYLSGYQGQTYPGVGVYPGATQQLASNPMMALIAPLLGNYSGAQNYGAGYGGGIPAYQPSYAPTSYPGYAATSYPAGPQYGDNDGDEGFEGHRHHHHFDGGGAGYGPYGGGGYGQYGSGGYGPYGSGAYGPYNSAGYGPYAGRGYGPYGPTPVSQALGHHHFNRAQFFSANAGAPGRGWGSRPFASMGGARRWGRNH